MDTRMVPGEIGIIPEHREVIGTPREVYGPYWDLVERRRKEQGSPPPTPSKPNPNWEGGRPPLSFLPPSSFFPLLLLIGKRGVLLPVGVGIPPLGTPPSLAGPLLHSFIYRGRGHPRDTTIDH